MGRELDLQGAANDLENLGQLALSNGVLRLQRPTTARWHRAIPADQADADVVADLWPYLAQATRDVVLAGAGTIGGHPAHAATSNEAAYAELLNLGGRVVKTRGKLLLSVGIRGDHKLPDLEAMRRQYGGTISTSYVWRAPVGRGRKVLDELWPWLGANIRSATLGEMAATGWAVEAEGRDER